MNVILAKRGIQKNSLKCIRMFASQNGDKNNQELFESIFDDILKKVETIQEEYFTYDTKPTKEEVHQEVLRSAHLARYALDQTLDKMGHFTNTFSEKRKEFEVLKGKI